MNELFAGMYFFFCNIGLPQSHLLYRVELAQLSQKFCSGHMATGHRGRIRWNYAMASQGHVTYCESLFFFWLQRWP